MSKSIMKSHIKVIHSQFQSDKSKKNKANNNHDMHA